MDDDKPKAAEVSGAESLLLEMLGLPFLSFVLNAEPDNVTARLTNSSLLSAEREKALKALVTFLGLVPREDPFSISYLLSPLGNYSDELGTNWANAMRRELGGGSLSTQSDDPATSALLSLAHDAYPLLLLPWDPQQPWQRPSLTGAVYHHPQREQFEAAVMADPVLAQMFPETSDTTGRSGQFFTSTGRGGGVQLVMFSEALIQNAWRVLEEAGETPAPDQFGRQVAKALPFARGALAKEKLTITARAGITGLRLPDDTTEIQLPWGRLRLATDTDRRSAPPSLEGKLTGSSDRGQVEIDYAGDLVLEVDVPYRIRFGNVNLGADSQWPVELVSSEVLERRLETLAVALLLSWEEPVRPTMAPTWRRFADPITFGTSMAWSDPRRLPAFVPVLLTTEEVSRWQEWIEQVDKCRVPSIAIALRRTLQATAERTDPTDALVDAVIAWENLVGSSQGEPTLRVSAALAWLLGDTAADRKEIRKQVSDLYALRSKVVHGARVLDPQQAHKERGTALDIAIRALRVLFSQRTELLTDCKDSTERSLRLLLDERDDKDLRSR